MRTNLSVSSTSIVNKYERKEMLCYDQNSIYQFSKNDRISTNMKVSEFVMYNSENLTKTNRKMENHFFQIHSQSEKIMITGSEDNLVNFEQKIYENFPYLKVLSDKNISSDLSNNSFGTKKIYDRETSSKLNVNDFIIYETDLQSEQLETSQKIINRKIKDRNILFDEVFKSKSLEISHHSDDTDDLIEINDISNSGIKYDFKNESNFVENISSKKTHYNEFNILNREILSNDIINESENDRSGESESYEPEVHNEDISKNDKIINDNSLIEATLVMADHIRSDNSIKETFAKDEFVIEKSAANSSDGARTLPKEKPSKVNSNKTENVKFEVGVTKKIVEEEGPVNEVNPTFRDEVTKTFRRFFN